MSETVFPSSAEIVAVLVNGKRLEMDSPVRVGPDVALAASTDGQKATITQTPLVFVVLSTDGDNMSVIRGVFTSRAEAEAEAVSLKMGDLYDERAFIVEQHPLRATR